MTIILTLHPLLTSCRISWLSVQSNQMVLLLPGTKSKHYNTWQMVQLMYLPFRSSMLTNGSSSPVTRTTSIRPAAVNNQTPLNSTSQLGVNSLDSEVTDSLGNCDNTSLSNCDIKLQENIEINQDQSCEPETCNASFSDESHSKSQSSDLSASVDVEEDVIEKENSNPLDENFNGNIK